MATRSQELSVKLTADSSDLTKATADASRALTDLKTDIGKVDAETIEITPEVEMSRIDRDLANLNKTLDGLERRKASPDVDMDLTQLLKDEAKVRAAIEDLDKRKIEVEARIDVDTTGLDQLRATVDDLDTDVGGLIPGLSGLSGVLGNSGVAGAATLAGGAFAAWNLGGMAGDVETTKLSLEALTGSAEEGAAAFDLLQQFAKTTPFELDAVTASAQSLLAAGLDMEEVPGVLTDIGNASSALNAPLEEVVTVLGQMYLKGKVSNEELLQLSERKIPAFDALATSMGVTVEQLQEMASQGKLGREEIDLLIASLGDMFPTSMQQQADSFNGKMSTLSDTFSQLGAAIGQEVLPAMDQMVTAMTLVGDAGLYATDKLHDFNAELAVGPSEDDASKWDVFGDAVGGAFKQIITGPQGLEEPTSDIHALGVVVTSVSGQITDAMPKISTAFEETEVTAEDLEAALGDLLDQFTLLKGEGLDAAEAQLAFRDGLEGLAKAAKEAKGEIAGAGEKSLAFKIAIGDSVTGIEEWAEAELQAGTNVKAVNRGIEDRVDALVKATGATGEEKRAVEDYIAAILKTPKERTTEMKAILDADSALDTKQRLDEIAADRTARIKVQIDVPYLKPEERFLLGATGVSVGGLMAPTGPEGVAPLGISPLSAPGITPTLMSGTTTLRVAAPPAKPAPVQITPKSTPVKVYLDGEEISDKLVTRVASRFTPAGRGSRRP